ncbi:hypothetical protein [Rhizobium sp. AB2/73]|uniref:hypothetical protein n=1 Tax=Rhizobium sp. AB2/73 TaxID=2795216 RepID=UPI001C5F54FF|nr:hypothetical protein [Rhizobium sp. AB2/73]QYA17472.1 hypothetical protein J5284_33960 [Rhizobium sp. AB2/73]UEQ85793.1 hypothetical protein I8E17_33940 [Rhizobium sp. AB2/73]
MTVEAQSQKDPPVKLEDKEQDEFLQEALEETFPASDPISPGHPSHAKPPANRLE